MFKGSVAQIACWPRFPFPRTDLSHGFRDRYAERGVAVQDGDADLELGDLTVEVPSHEPLAQQLHAMHLRLDAASAVISAPSSPDRAAEVFRCPQCFVSCDRTGGDRLPRLGVLAGWDDCVGTAIGDRVVALSSIVGAIRGDAADLLVRGDLTEKIGQHRCISDVARGDLDGSNFQCFLIDPEVDLAPGAAFRATMLAGVPLAFALDLDARAVDEQVQRALRPTVGDVDGQGLLAAGQRAEVGDRLL